MSDNPRDNGGAPEDDNPWDDGDAGQTVATGAPMELPSNIPSPISHPPPAAVPAPARMPAPAPAPSPVAAVPRLGPTPAAKKAGKQTMIGIAGPAPGAYAPPGMQAPPLSATPASAPKPAARVPSADAPSAAPRPPAPAIPTRSAPTPPAITAGRSSGGAAPASDRSPSPMRAPSPSTSNVRAAAPSSPSFDDDQDDGPTMAVPPDEMGAQAVASMREEALRRAGVGGFPKPPVDKDAETMGLPSAALGRAQHEVHEETTRAVARDELIRPQDARVATDEDVVGDEATLAVDLGAKQQDFAAKYAETIGRPSAPVVPTAPDRAPAFPPPPGASPHAPMQGHGHAHAPPAPGSNPQVAAAANLNVGGTGPMPAYTGGAPVHQGFDPMMPGAPPAYPSSGQHPIGAGHSANAMQGGMQNAAPMNAPGADPPPPWMTQPTPPRGGGLKLNKQMIVLGVVGFVCLTIFVVGIVLFATTNFN